ncbi:MAG: radical SAM protein [Nitrospinae bacterium]|nr:radical SAM protein [Nitrospinota bacterium]
MRILLVNPRFPPSLWDFSHIRHINGSNFPFPPLGLAVLASLTPPGHEITILDENAQSLDFTANYDLVGITGYDVQKERALEIARSFRKTGVTVALGGPMVHETALDEFGKEADALFVGEAEETWPQYIADLLDNSPKGVYRQDGFPQLSPAPLPRFDLLNISSYATAIMETSRGCPFTCEFCEVPVRMGDTPRLKDPMQVLNEIELLASRGADSVFIIDDNFTGNRKHAMAVLSAVERRQRESDKPMSFSCQLTLANAFDDELLSLLRRCGFRWVFIGLETSDKETLEKMGKRQNLSRDVIKAVRNIQSHNLVIWGGIIVGFDGDDEETIERQRRFVEEAGVPVVMASLLQALPGTKLYERMKNEGRLTDANLGGVRGDKSSMLQTNIKPLKISAQELADQYIRLMDNLYSFPNYAGRLLKTIRQAREDKQAHRSKPSLASLRPLLGLASYYYLTTDPRRVFYFFRVLWAAMRRNGLGAETVFMHLAVYIHLRKFHEELSLQHRT